MSDFTIQSNFEKASDQKSNNEKAPSDPAFDVLIIGAGFAGMYMLHRARGLGLRARLLEQGHGVGGTWYWNRYPGARCDVESLEYSYQFSQELQQEWQWTERFAAQPEILRYANHVAERFDLLKDIAFGSTVDSAVLDESNMRWAVGTNQETLSARFLVMATGCLSSANRPKIPGADTFLGKTYHTGQWPHEPVNFTGLNVGVIGTGSSAVQSIPIIAKQARSLTVFQRTATFSVPARNGPIDPVYERQVKENYPDFRARNNQMMTGFGANVARLNQSAHEVTSEQREAAYRNRWELGGLNFGGVFTDTLLSQTANEFAADFVRARIRETVKDPVTAALLSPKQIIGCKRLCIDSGYFETFNLPHVKLVDISQTAIERTTSNGLVIAGQEFALDAIVYATGFDAMTGSVLKINPVGRAGQTLAQAWSTGPRTYLGLGVVGFPNLFTISGPGSPSVLTNMLVSIEQHVNWISTCIADLDATGKKWIEASLPAQEAWVEHVNMVANSTLYPTCNSWYLGANVPGKTRIFMPLLGFPNYVEKCRQVAAKGYEGFVLG